MNFKPSRLWSHPGWLLALWLYGQAGAGAAEGKGAKFQPTWESLKQYQAPEWFKDAKFGVFVHWGVYAVPAYGDEWYPRRMYRKGDLRKGNVYEHHRQTWGDQAKFGYKDFIPLFKAEKWDPRAWAELFQKAGAGFVVPVAEHHDGFAMYDSSLTRWNAVQMGPHRDIVGELAAALRQRGLKVGLSSHYAYNWQYYKHSDEFDTNDPKYAGLYGRPHDAKAPASAEFLEHWYARVMEITTKYQPDLLWFDFDFNPPEFEPYRKRIAANYYNQALEQGREVVLNYKLDAYPDGAAVLDVERGKLEQIRSMVWQTDTSVSRKSWGYIEGDEFKPVDSLIDDLVDVVSKNGVLLLNVGPKADGTIPAPAEEILLGIGKWLAVNGEAIYGTRPWHTFGEGPTQETSGRMAETNNPSRVFTAADIRFTTKSNALYAICLDWPEKPLNIRSLSTRTYLSSQGIQEVSLLGSKEAIKWTRDAEGLKITPPSAKPCDYAFAFKIVLKGQAKLL